jgi:hypothetical protein
VSEEPANLFPWVCWTIGVVFQTILPESLVSNPILGLCLSISFNPV